jgi:hypothetical protein
MNEHQFTLSRSSGSGRGHASEISEAFNWTHQTIDLLRQLDGVLSKTVETWKSFYSPDGDIGYFHDNSAAISPHTRQSLSAIKVIFRRLQEGQQKMVLLNKCCTEFRMTVSGTPSDLLTAVCDQGTRCTNHRDVVEPSLGPGGQRNI